MSLSFVLEIGTEEVPDWMIVPALNNLQDMFQALLDQQALGGRVDETHATPRRLFLRAQNLVEHQVNTEETVSGPPTSAGAGAAAGFAKKMGTTPDQLGKIETPKGEYFAFQKRTQGQATADVLARELPPLILKIQWPKSMVWRGKGTERFIRPIRWLVALLGDSVVPFDVAGVKSGNVTHGRRGTPPVTVTIHDFSQKLKANGVILSAAERRERIESGIAGLRVKPDPDLLHTLTYITEFPTPIVGSFDPSYLDLPKEVLVEVMRHHQKYLSVEDADGNLAPQFVTVTNTDGDPDGLIRQGNEKVLRARFNDARFFWDQDQKRKLEDRLEDLKNVTFQASIGSYFEKVERVAALVIELNGSADAIRAARLCKCDLTTEMVKEFTDLQGIIGGLYAKAQGTSEAVWHAIYDHYKPLSMQDSIPSTLDGQIVALADKMDTLRECFRVGLAPSGSKDPFALRRAAQGVVKILAEGNLPYGLDRLIYLLGADAYKFVWDRCHYYFETEREFKYDELKAVKAASDLPDMESRLRALSEVRATPNFEPIAASAKRIRNILKQANFTDPVSLDDSLLEDGPERELYLASERVRPELSRINYRAQLEAVASLRPQVDAFFDKVLINVDNPRLRANRLTLLKRLLSDFSRVADLSEIVTERQS